MLTTTVLTLTEDELFIIYDALDRMLNGCEPGSLAFLAETNERGQSFRRRAELTRARIAEHLH